ncbi:MAG: hypothetical protein H6682_11110 [Candidatus Eisenbacteria bacterium]|nr:hypothetical protein [Candidatus Eisenbacteria bacterium]
MRRLPRAIGVLLLISLWVTFQAVAAPGVCRCHHGDVGSAQVEGAACCCSSRASGSDGISPQAAWTTQTAHAQAETGSCCQSQKTAPVSRCAGFTGTLAFGERCGCQPDVSEASVAPATVVFEFAAYAGELLQIVVRDLERPQERDGPAERLFLRRLTTPSVDVFLRVLHLLD